MSSFEEWFKGSKYYHFWSAWDSPFLMKQAYRAGQIEFRGRVPGAMPVGEVGDLVDPDAEMAMVRYRDKILALPLEGDE